MTYRFFALCLMLVTILPNGLAQSKDEKAMAVAVERLRNAMIAADVTTLNELTAAELSYGHSSGKIDTKAEFVGDLQSGKSDFVTITLSDQTIKIVGKTAMVRHKLAADVQDNGKANSLKLSVLTIWVKQSGKWLLLARQAVKIV